MKVADFGLSCVLQTSELRDKDMAIGSARWMAPEVLMGHNLNDKLDVYSFGLIMWEIFTRTEPYKEFKSLSDFRDAICQHGVRPELKKAMPPIIASILKLCWASSPNERPSFVAVCAFFYIAKRFFRF